MSKLLPDVETIVKIINTHSELDDAAQEIIDLFTPIKAVTRSLIDTPRCGEPLRDEGQWQPIETAPKDGTEIWCYTVEGNQRSCYWDEATSDASDDMGHDAGWVSSCGQTYWGRSFGNPEYFREPFDPPTHWMPLPSPPITAHEAKQEE